MLTLDAARWLLVLHAVLAAAAVGASTHLVLWLRPYRRGRFARHRAARRFAWLALGLSAATFLVGNVLYPTYKVQVRLAYLENAPAVAEAAQRQAEEVARVTGGRGAPSLEDAEGAEGAEDTADLARRAARIARWFDVKEHWTALGLVVSAAVALLLAAWHPDRDGPALVPVALGLAVLSAATVWAGALIGVVTAAWRAV